MGESPIIRPQSSSCLKTGIAPEWCRLVLLLTKVFYQHDTGLCEFVLNIQNSTDNPAGLDASLESTWELILCVSKFERFYHSDASMTLFEVAGNSVLGIFRVDGCEKS